VDGFDRNRWTASIGIRNEVLVVRDLLLAAADLLLAPLALAGEEGAVVAVIERDRLVVDVEDAADST
jgi:hypothetical protein